MTQLYLYRQLPHARQAEAWFECYPLPPRSRKRLTPAQSEQLDRDLEDWARRWWSDSEAKRKGQEDAEQAAMKRELVQTEYQLAEKFAILATRTGDKAYSEFAAHYTAKHRGFHRPVLILLGVELPMMGVN